MISLNVLSCSGRNGAVLIPPYVCARSRSGSWITIGFVSLGLWPSPRIDLVLLRELKNGFCLPLLVVVFEVEFGAVFGLLVPEIADSA